MWKPDLDGSQRPMYEQIRDAIIADIRVGKLEAGALLPSHRDLADDLGVSVGTVSRAFKALVDQELVDADGRRGTRVREASIKAAQDKRLELAVTQPPHDLRGHLAAFPTWDAEIREAMTEIGHRNNLDGILDYQAITGREQHREAGARWLEYTSNAACHVDEVVVFNGAQHALTCALLATCSPGDMVATERLTYAGLRVAAPSLGLTLVPVEIDEEGILPEAFLEVCTTQPIRALVCVPNLHNPTTKTLAMDRREAILEIALRHNVVVIEDDVYGGLLDKKIPPMFTIAPENVIRLTGLSKTLGPGLRVGFVQAKQSRISELSTSLRATSWMASPLMAEVAAHLIGSGRAEVILKTNMEELKSRNDILIDELERFKLSTARHGTHAWLELPPTWTREDFAVWSQNTGIQALTADAYIVGSGKGDEAVRISVSGARSGAALRDAAQRMAKALERPPEISSTVL